MLCYALLCFKDHRKLLGLSAYGTDRFGCGQAHPPSRLAGKRPGNNMLVDDIVSNLSR